MQTLELKIPPVVQVLIMTFLMWILAVALPSLDFTWFVSLYLAFVCVIIGPVFAVLGVMEFRSAGTTVDPRVPEQSESLVVSGVYRLSRNPMYVGFLLILVAVGLLLSNLASLALLPAFVIYMNKFQIVPEERLMRKKFGQHYQHYQSTVRRWI